MVSLAEQNSWYPQIGDMIVVYPRHLEPHEDGYIGTIRSYGKINGSDAVHVMWSNPNHAQNQQVHTGGGGLPQPMQQQQQPAKKWKDLIHY